MAIILLLVSGSLPIAAAVRHARVDRGLSVLELSERSGVSRAMINKIERDDVQPTAQLLARIALACDITLSRLISAAEDGERRISPRDRQALWTDPSTGYSRRALSPSARGTLDLVEVELPASTEVSYAPDSYPVVTQQVWLLEGHLEITDDDHTARLEPGDCMQLDGRGGRRYRNPGHTPCRYLLAVILR